MMAARYGHGPIASLLIEAGADVNCRNEDQRTALHFAADKGQSTMVSALVRVEGLDINPQDGEGATPLHYACGRGSLETVRALLVAGAATNIADHYDETALGFGVRLGRLGPETIQLLVQHSA